VWLVFALLASGGAAVLCVIPKPRVRERWTRFVARALLRFSSLKVQVQGRAPSQPAVFVANHASYADSLILTALLPPGAHFAAKREFASVPVLGWLLARFGTRFVERPPRARRLKARAICCGGARRQSLSHPEGTFTREPGLRAFRMGAFVAAAQSGRPVVPVALRGTRSVLRAGSLLPRRVPVEVFIATPLAPRGSDWSDALELRDAARRAILAHCGEPDRGAPPAA
jgi:1-acyl-sn-glycerol-3-phosphate acyltransferase